MRVCVCVCVWLCCVYIYGLVKLFCLMAYQSLRVNLMPDLVYIFRGTVCR